MREGRFRFTGLGKGKGTLRAESRPPAGADKPVEAASKGGAEAAAASRRAPKPRREKPRRTAQPIQQEKQKSSRARTSAASGPRSRRT